MLSVDPSAGLDLNQAGPVADPAGATQVQAGTLSASGPIRTASDVATDTITIADTYLAIALRTALSLPAGVNPTEAQLASLTELSAPSKSIVSLAGLQYCINLQKITLNNNRIVDLTPLKDLQLLWNLNLSNNQIVSLAPLKGLTNLTTLQLNSNKIVDLTDPASQDPVGSAGILGANWGTILGGLTKLTSLSLNNNKIVNVTALGILTTLTSLSVSGNLIVDIGPLASLTSLTSLTLSSNEIVDIGPLASLTSLTSLTLDSNKIVSIASVSSMVHLTSLSIQQNLVTDLAPVAGILTLQTIVFNQMQVTSLTPLEDLTNLTTISGNSNQITDLTPLAGLTNLTSLTLGYNTIVSLEPLASLTGLTDVDLRHNKIVDVTPLEGLTGLTSLILQYNLIVDIQPLVANAGLSGDSNPQGARDTVDLIHNPLTADTGAAQVAVLSDRHVNITYTPRIAPTINLLRVSHSSIHQGRTLTLSIQDGDIVKHDLELQKVEFYCDIDHDGVADANELIYADSNVAGGWTWSGPVTWAAGTGDNLKFYARAINEWDDASADVWVQTKVLPVNTAPVSQPQSLRMAGTSSIDITLGATDAETTSPMRLDYEVDIRPAHGTFTLTNNTLTYTPQPGFFGTDTFTFKANDGLDHSTPSSVTIIVPLVASSGHKVSFYDANDDLVTVRLSGPGKALVYAASGQGSDASDIVLTGTTAKSSVSVSTPGRAPTVNFDQIKLDGGWLKSFSARQLNLAGDVTVVGAGGFGSLTLGDVAAPGEQTIQMGLWSKPASVTLGSVSDLNLSSGSPIQSLSVGKWLDSAASPADSITAPWIGSLTVRGDFQPDMTLSNPGSLPLALRSAKISGAVAGATWAVTGGIGAITAGVWAADGLTAGTVKSLKVNGNFTGSATIAGDVGTIAIKGDFGGTLAAGSIKSMAVTGDLANATLDLALPLGGVGLGSLKVGGWIRNSDILAKASLGAISAGGIQDSGIFAGVTAFGSSPIADDKCDLNQGATLKSLTIKGTQRDNGFSVERSQWGAWQIGTLSLAYPDINDPAGDLAMTGTFTKGSYKGIDGKTYNLINVLQNSTPAGLQILELI